MPRFHVRRTIVVDASLAEIYSAVVDFRTWPAWSPWLLAEPDAQVFISSDPDQVDSTYEWKGELVGEGMIIHRMLEPEELVKEEIRFLKPFRSRADVWFEMRQTHEGNELAWNMDGSLPWFLFWMKRQMQTFVGMDYERGLLMFKEYIETGEVKAKTQLEGVVDIEPTEIVGLRRSFARKDLGTVMPQLVEDVKALFGKHGLAHGRAATVCHHFDYRTDQFEMTAGYECNAPVVDLPTDLSLWSLPAGKAIHVKQTGSYKHLGNAWSAGMQFLRYRKLKANPAGSFEIYQNNPETTPEDELQTDVYVTVKG